MRLLTGSKSTASGRSKVTGTSLLLVLGLWGALVPFVGPTFGFSMGGAPAWTWTESSVTLHLVPGVAAVLGAVLLMRGRLASQVSGAVLALLGGIWFVIAPSLRPLWAGQPTSSTSGMVGMGGMEHSALSSALSALGYHYGTGVLVSIVAAYALGALAKERRAAAGDRIVEGRPTRTAAADSGLVDAQH
jgi:hypothetical protein